FGVRNDRGFSVRIIAEYAHLNEGKTMLADKKKTGNITGMAIARNIIAIFEECSQGLQKSKDFAFPERVRRELAETIEACWQKKKEIEELYTTAVAPLEADYYNRFVEKAKAQSGADQPEAQLKALFKNLMAGEDRGSVQPGGETKAPGPAAEPAPAVPEILGASGPAKNWVSIGFWTAEVSAVEMIRIPVLKIAKPSRQTIKSEESGRSISTAYRPLRVLTKGTPGLAFQAKSMPGRLGADIVEWPSARNEWRLLARVKPLVNVPSKHGMEIQVAGEASAQELGTFLAESAALANRNNAAAPAVATPPQPPPNVKIRIASDPAGAVVHLNGKQVVVGGASVATPCVVEAAPGKHDISLKLFGYVDGNFIGFNAGTNAAIIHMFSEDTTAAVESSLKIFASEGWRESQVTVANGDRLIISVSGAWSCAPREEKVGPEGYPQDAAHNPYYLGPSALPRVHARANLGALLMKIGAKGGARVMGRSQRVVAEAAGPLYFGVNEADRDNSLADNKGGLTIYIQNLGSGSGK
ncbi:MAG: PEGA domain-containing protein, partial [Verrucomicrobiota bacterium]|nr:PEGA domain-containing protein [Verrucomicrobiota bacterium]